MSLRGKTALTLAHHFSHIVKGVLISHFLLVWLFFLVVTVVCALCLSDTCDSSAPHPRRNDRSDKHLWLGALNLTDAIAALVLVLFVVFYVMVILYKEDFAYYSNDQLTDFSVQGRSFPPPIWLGAGRFIPLALQEFNVLALITKSPAGFHSFAVVQLLILALALLLVLKEFKFVYRVLMLIAVMLAPSFVISFTGLIYPERNILFWLAIMLLCLHGHSKTKSATYFAGCLVATHFALYYKETVVIFVVGFIVARLLLQVYAGHRSWHEFIGENSLSLGMLAISGIYVVLFVAAMFPRRNFSYIAEQHKALTTVPLAYLRIDWLPFILLAVLLVRLSRLTLSGGQLDPMWDPLALGAFAYSGAIIALGLFGAYYMAPVDFIALLYLAGLSVNWLSRPTRARVSALAIVFICVLLLNTAYSSFRVVERKNVIATTSEFADFLKSYLMTVKSSTVQLFFPYAHGRRPMQLSAYLRFKGFNLVGQSAMVPEAGPRLVVEGPERFINNRCVEDKDYVCIHAENPTAGGLIVVLADDDVSMNDVENIGRNSTLLLFLKAPGICTRKWFRLLHPISPIFGESGLPEHWLQLHVFKKGPPA